MAIEKTIVLNVNAQEALKELTKLGKQFEEDYQNADNLTAEIGALEDALYEMARSGKQGTKEFNALSAEVGKMKKVIIDTDMVVDGMSQTLAQNLGGALGGITSAFELGAGVMGAMGVESEKVEEALLKVQSASAIAQGFQGIRESVSSFKALGVAIRSSAVAQKLLNLVMSLNPIGLIITAIAALIAGITALIMNFEAIMSFLGLIDDEQETLHKNQLARNREAQAAQDKKLKELAKEKDELGKKHSFQERLMKAQGKSEEQIFQAIRKNRLERIKASEEFSKQTEIKNDLLIAEFKLLQANGDLTKEEADRINEAIKENNKIIIDSNNERRALTEEIRLDDVAKTTAAENKKTEAVKKANEKQAEIRKEAFEKRKARIIAEMEEEARLRRETDTFLKDLEERQAAEKELKEKAAQEDKEREQSLLEQIQASLDAELAAEEAKVDAAIESDNKKKELAEAELLREQELQKQKLELTSAAFGAIGDLINSFAGESEAAQERAFNVTKAVNLAQAITNTALAVTAALTAGGNPIKLATGAQFIEAGIAAAAGAAQIATIARTQFNAGGGGGGGAGANIPNPPTGGGANPATFNVVGNTGTNQLAQTLGQQPLQAYVVAGDVTSAQSLERNKIQQSTL